MIGGLRLFLCASQNHGESVMPENNGVKKSAKVVVCTLILLVGLFIAGLIDSDGLILVHMVFTIVLVSVVAKVWKA